ncbi:unnamed protein product [Owenia fusiformis]|uniref:Uncharacterized protein n=1 Tax=Owenia fusiformis TaxID=6347 RepID=A0A8J1XGK9_OWEFU|nr:unnamed protein product [Owenia fusiformis]
MAGKLSGMCAGSKIIYLFCLFACLTSFLIGTETANRQSVFTTLERRFRYKSVTLGFVISAYDFGFFPGTILFGLIADRLSSIPRLVHGSALGLCLSSFLFLLPHLIFGPGDDIIVKDAIPTEGTEEVETDLCGIAATSFVNTSYQSNNSYSTAKSKEECSVGQINHIEQGVTSFIIVVAQILIGASLAPVTNVSVSFVDRQLQHKGTSIYIACVWGSFFAGVTFGYLLGALYTSFYIDLSDPGIDANHSSWIGAWWLGSVTTCCLSFLLTCAYFCIPSHIPGPPAIEIDKEDKEENEEIDLNNLTKNKTEYSAMLGDNNEDQHYIKAEEVIGANDNKHDRQFESDAVGIEMDHLNSNASSTDPKNTGTLQAFKKLVCNPVYIGLVIGNFPAVWIYGMYGSTFLPKYLETQFHTTASMSNMLAAILGGGGTTLGMIVSAIIQEKFKLTLRQTLKLIVGGSVAAMCIPLIFLTFNCHQPPLTGQIDQQGVSESLSCVANCACDVTVSPVCVDGTTSYFSACLAGCKQTEVINDQQYYSNCSCLHGNSSVVKGWCPNNCTPMVTGYIIFCFALLMIVTGTQLVLPVTCVLLIVEPKYSNYGLGLLMAVQSLLGWFPGPTTYGGVIDSACLVWESKCGERGNCMVYDTRLYNYRYNTFTSLLQVVAICANSFAYHKWKKDSDRKTNNLKVTIAD